MKNKISYLLIIFISLFIFSSCSIFSDTTTNNEVKKTVTYEEVTIADFNNAIEHVAEVANNCCVAIIATDPGWISTQESLGSGVIVKKETVGINTYKYYVVTNRHVISFASSINTSKQSITNNVYIHYSSNTTSKISATVVSYSTDYDIALLSFTSNLEFNVATLATEDTISLGSIVVACGTPLGLEYFNTISQGVVSCEARILGQTKFNSTDVINTPFIQHTAEINSGNSGGGLFDYYGNLIGLNTLQYNKTGVQGMNFALPISIVRTFILSKITL